MTARDIIQAKYPDQEARILGVRTNVTMWNPFPERRRVIEAQSVLTLAQNSVSPVTNEWVAELLEVDETLENAMEAHQYVFLVNEL